MRRGDVVLTLTGWQAEQLARMIQCAGPQHDEWLQEVVGLLLSASASASDQESPDGPSPGARLRRSPHEEPPAVTPPIIALANDAVPMRKPAADAADRPTPPYRPAEVGSGD